MPGDHRSDHLADRQRLAAAAGDIGGHEPVEAQVGIVRALLLGQAADALRLRLDPVLAVKILWTLVQALSGRLRLASAELIEFKLKSSGFDVFAFPDGEAALAAAESILPDLVLLDWMMPEMDGPATCEALRANPETADIPIVFMTAKSQGFEIERGLALGAAGYIVKPFDALTLGEQLRDILGDKA